MIVVWTPRATSDLDEVVDYIGADSIESALNVADRIGAQVAQLSSFPWMGRTGEVSGTRELVFHPWSYIAVYEVSGGEVRILRIRHAARNWP